MLIFDQLRQTDRPLRWLAYGVTAGLVLLLGGLWYVQVLTSQQFVRDQRNQSLRTVRIPAIRGRILDRNQQAIVANQPSYTINLYLEELRDLFRAEYTNHVKSDYLLRAPGGKVSPAEIVQLERLARYRVVSNIIFQVSTVLRQPLAFNERRFHKHYETLRALPWPVVENLAPEQVARFVERSASIPGVELEIQPLRSYPFATSAAHVLGHLLRTDSAPDDVDVAFNYRLPDFQGDLGVEALFDHQLRGKAGMKSMVVNNLNYRQSDLLGTPALPGQDVVLTLDLEIQQAAERAMRWAGDKARGAVVVLDVLNGDLLAVVSAPTFDPSLFLSRMPVEEWARLSDEKLTPMVNRATYGAYPPGSAFKLIVALALLDGGLDATESLIVEPDPQDPARGCIFVGRRKIKDTAAPGSYDFIRAFKRSSNSYFIHHGLKAGLNAILSLGHAFHFGERVSVLPRQELAGYFPPEHPRVKRDGTLWLDGDTANLCIGQGDITVTPMQMAVMTAAIANGGKVFWPRLVARLTPTASDPDRPSTVFPAGRLREQLKLDPHHLQRLREAMLADVRDADGTGHSAEVPGLNVCGKTGTAQITQGRTVVDHITWFVSFAPFESPRYAVVVMVESGGSGGGTCAPIAQRVYQALQKRDLARPAAAVRYARTP